MKTGLSVADAMTRSPIHMHPSATLTECAKEMAKHHVGSMLVKDGDALKGIITEQDIVRKGIAEGLDHNKITISELMETRLHTITPHSDIYEALVKMRDLNIRHLPVVDDDKFFGFLTLKDVLKVQPQLFDLLVDDFELREEGRKPVVRNLSSEGVCELCGNYTQRMFKTTEGANACVNCR